MSQKAYESNLEASLAGSIAEREIVPPFIGPYDKYVQLSLLHKAVRRGQVDLAGRAAVTLIENDAPAFWRRIGIVALEEVGAASPLLVGQCLWVSGKVVWRQEHGGEKAIACHLVTRLCHSIKDRNSCQIPVAAALSRHLAEESTRPIYEAVIGLWQMQQRPIDADTFRLPAHQRDAFNGAVAELGVPDEIRYLTDLATRRTSDAMSIGIVGAWLLMKGKSVSFKPEELIGNELIGSFPACTWDKHTAKGKGAMTEFARLTGIAKHLSQTTDKANAVGLAVFFHESQRVNQRLTYEKYDEPMLLSVIGWLQLLGLNQEEALELLLAVKFHFHELKSIRIRLLERH